MQHFFLQHSIVNSARGTLLVMLAIMAVLFSGCATTEPENASARPWNQPRGWETGLPPAMYQGR